MRQRRARRPVWLRVSGYAEEPAVFLRISEDITAAYRKLVVDGCKRMRDGGSELLSHAKAYPEAMLALLDLWASRMAAFDSGLLKVMRFSAIKPSGLRLLSDW
jgi:hypothetical protein